MIIITEINITQDSEFVKSFLRELFLLSSVIIIAEQKVRLYMLYIGKGDVSRHVAEHEENSCCIYSGHTYGYAVRLRCSEIFYQWLKSQ